MSRYSRDRNPEGAFLNRLEHCEYIYDVLRFFLRGTEHNNCNKKYYNAWRVAVSFL